MNRIEAIQKLREERWQVPPGLEFQVRLLQPEDAWGVARCFYAIYGAEYPIETYYLPEKLLEESARGNVYSAVAQVSNGDIIGYGALYRSSCPHPRVFEVCQHLMTQRMGYRNGYPDCALEVGLMPAAAYPRTEFATDRVSALLHFRTFEDRQQTVYVPARYREELAYLVGGMKIARTLQECGSAPAAAAATQLPPEYVEFAQVARAHVSSTGADFDRVTLSFDAESRQRGARVLQFTLNLGEPAVESAVELLRSQGYFFGGFLPRWFETDALMMQKVLDLPDFRSIKLYS